MDKSRNSDLVEMGVDEYAPIAKKVVKKVVVETTETEEVTEA